MPVCGDLNGDGAVNVNDIVILINICSFYTQKIFLAFKIFKGI